MKKALQNKYALTLAFLGLMLSSATASAATGIMLPLTSLFCSIAGAMQSQWAPGIALIVLIVEGFLLYMAKKGVMEKLLWFTICTTIVFTAGSWLGMISPTSMAACAGIVN